MRLPDAVPAAALAALALGVASCGEVASGSRAYREGRFAEALAAFDAAARAEGDGASAEVLWDRALAALGTGDARLALSSADAAAARGGPEFGARRDFLRGNVAFAMSAADETEASRPGADANALDRAVLHAEDAVASWRMACASSGDGPEARRNLERGLLRLDALRKKRGSVKGPGAERAHEVPGTGPMTPPPQPLPEAPPPAPPLPPPPETPGPNPPEAPGAAEAEDLPPERVMRLLDVLLEKEREKAALRRASRPAGSGSAENDR